MDLTQPPGRAGLLALVALALAALSPSPGRAGTGTDRLYSGEKLRAGQVLASPNSRYLLRCQADGNVVLYNTATSTPIWHSNTWVPKGADCVLSVEANGDLVVSHHGGWLSGRSGPTVTRKWSSQTVVGQRAYLRVQDDGNLVLYQLGNNKVLWSSNTFGK